VSTLSAAAEAAPAKVRKFPCASCGADVVWSPGAAALVCPYCGVRREVPKTPGEVKERPI
jgi:DNA-directed RNA polymerase subunit RPC12/RpoP